MIAPLRADETEQVQPPPNQRIKVCWKSNYYDQAGLLLESARTTFE